MRTENEAGSKLVESDVAMWYVVPMPTAPTIPQRRKQRSRHLCAYTSIDLRLRPSLDPHGHTVHPTSHPFHHLTSRLACTHHDNETCIVRCHSVL